MIKRIISVLLTLVIAFGVSTVAFSAYAEGIAVASVSAANDGISINKNYLCVGEPLDISNPNGYRLRYYVDGEMPDSDEFILLEDYYECWITVKAYQGKTLIDQDEVYFSKLPVLYINTDDGAPITSKEVYKTGDMFIQSNEVTGSAVYDGDIKIRGRGNSTWYWPKKPYRIKLDKSADLFGMGKNKNWVLIANYLDECLLRNTTAFRVSEELGLETMSTVWTDVVFNGEYIGNYQLCEQVRIDEERVDIFDWEEEAKNIASAVAKAENKNGANLSKDDLEEYLNSNLSWVTDGFFVYNDKTYYVDDYYDAEDDISGGYLFELSDEYDEETKFTTDTGLKVMLKSPEFLRTNQDMLDYVMTYWQDFENAYRAEDGYTDTADGRKHYSEFADLDSMVSFWLVMEIMGNNDAVKKSRFAYMDIGDILRFGPVWDFDWGGGTLYVGTVATGWIISRSDNTQNFYKDFLDDPLFIAKATEKYWEIRPMLQSLIDEGGIIENDVEYLRESGLADHERWNRKDTWQLARGFEKDANVYLTYLRKRIAWLDKQFVSDSTLLNSVRTELSSSPYERSNGMLDIKLKNAVEDTFSEKAPADGIVPINKDAIVKVVVGDYETTSLNVYVNGLYYCSVPVSAGYAVFTVSSGKLTATEGNKNVISIIGKNDSGETTYRDFATVIRKKTVETVMLGDANADGSVTVLDATCVQRYIANLSVPNFCYEAAAFRGDEVSILTATAIQRWLVRLSVPFDIGEVVQVNG